MVKTLRQVGNSKAVILPLEMIKKYGLDQVILEETNSGILIRPVTKSNYHDTLEKLRKGKKALYKRMELQAKDPKTIKHYARLANNFSETDTNIINK